MSTPPTLFGFKVTEVESGHLLSEGVAAPFIVGSLDEYALVTVTNPGLPGCKVTMTLAEARRLGLSVARPAPLPEPPS